MTLLFVPLLNENNIINKKWGLIYIIFMFKLFILSFLLSVGFITCYFVFNSNVLFLTLSIYFPIVNGVNFIFQILIFILLINLNKKRKYYFHLTKEIYLQKQEQLKNRSNNVDNKYVMSRNGNLNMIYKKNH